MTTQEPVEEDKANSQIKTFLITSAVISFLLAFLWGYLATFLLWYYASSPFGVTLANSIPLVVWCSWPYVTLIAYAYAWVIKDQKAHERTIMVGLLPLAYFAVFLICSVTWFF